MKKSVIAYNYHLGNLITPLWSLNTQIVRCIIDNISNGRGRTLIWLKSKNIL